MRFLARALFAIALAVTLVGLSVLLLLQPAFTRSLSAATSESAAAGLTRAQAQSLAERVRAFVAEKRGALPFTVAGRPGFDAAAVSHLRDVANVMAGAKIATAVFGGACLAWIFVLARRKRWRELARGLRLGAGLSAGLVVVVGALSLWSFDAVFTEFHGIFFKAGTWTFPYDSLLIRLFPEPFWSTTAAALGAAVLLGAALLALVSVPLGRLERKGRA